VFQERKAGRPQKPSEQRRTERVVVMLTPAEKQRLQQYVAKESISAALREAANIIYKAELDIKGERAVQGLDDLSSFIREIGGALRDGDIEIIIKSERSVIKVKGGHIFFQAPQPLINKAAVKQEFKRLEQRCRKLVESPPIGEFIFQGDRFKYVSPRIIDIAGYESGRLLDEPVLDLVHPDDRGGIEEIVREGLRGREIPSQVRFRALRSGGEIIYVNASVTLIEYEGRPAISGNFVDLTDWKYLQKGLGELRRRMEQIS